MVKMQAVQSALAIRRQRSRREEVLRAKHRRESSASVLSTPRPSVISLDGHVYFDEKRDSKKVFGYVTMFHVGGVLILIGLMLVITSLMPGYVHSTTPQRRNDLLGTGSFFVFLGGALTTVSRFISNNEEKELNQYIQGRLARSKSGHRLNKDNNEGNNHTLSSEHQPLSENGFVPAHSSGSNNIEMVHQTNGHIHINNAEKSKEDSDDSKEETSTSTSTSSCEINPSFVVVGVDSPIPLSSSTEPVLSRILEEDEVDIETDATTGPLDSTPESSLTPTSLETQSLLDKHHSPRSGSKGSVKSSCKSLKLT